MRSDKRVIYPRLEHEMAKQGLNRYQVGQIAGIESDVGLGNRFRGTTPFQLSEMMLLSNHLGVPMTELFEKGE